MLVHRYQDVWSSVTICATLRSLIASRPLDASVFNFTLDNFHYVAILGEEPLESRSVRSWADVLSLDGGEPAALAPDHEPLLRALHEEHGNAWYNHRRRRIRRGARDG